MLPWTPSRPVDPLSHVHPPFLYPLAVEKHQGHHTPPQHPSQYPVVHLRFGRSSSLADLKFNAYMLPWTPSRPVDPLSHVHPPFLYPLAAQKHQGHFIAPQHPSQHPLVHLRFGRSRSLTDLKFKADMLPWTSSRPADLLTCRHVADMSARHDISPRLALTWWLSATFRRMSRVGYCR